MKEAIVLAGGLGTRLRSEIGAYPKPMAEVAGKPFLSYILDYLTHFEYDHIILAVGYKYEIIQDYFGSQYKNASLTYSIEEERLGTGGAIRLALELCSTEEILVCNGDSFADIDLNDFNAKTANSSFECTLALNSMNNIDRYGLVEIDETNCITKFKEKSFQEKALINSGIYRLKKSLFIDKTPEGNFSMENDYFEKYYGDKILGGFSYEAFFRDIGIPKDFNLAQNEFKQFTYQ